MKAPSWASCAAERCDNPVAVHVRPARDDFGFLSCWVHLAAHAMAIGKRKLTVTVYDEARCTAPKKKGKR